MQKTTTAENQFPEMTHTNFVSSIRYRPSPPLICTKNNQKHVFIFFLVEILRFVEIISFRSFLYILYIIIYFEFM